MPQDSLGSLGRRKKGAARGLSILYVLHAVRWCCWLSMSRAHGTTSLRIFCEKSPRRWVTPSNKKELLARDAKRNIGEELLQAIRDVKAGHYGARYKVEANDIVAARLKCGLSQGQFAAALRISPRTLQQWEQGRRQPSGAAETLLKIVTRHPEVLREVIAA